MEKFDFDFNEDDEQLVPKTPAEIKQDKRNEINRIMCEIHALEADFFRRKGELVEKAVKLEREILNGGGKG